ncbi:MAG: rane protein [Gammaproteobacteria bacterium]|nr:rane protein [Gammaproteobacteria bacterium]
MTIGILASVQSAIVWLFDFTHFLYRQFTAGRGLQTASALAYTTLLSIVPLVGVMFSFFGHLPVFKDISEIMQEFVFSNFVPEFGQTVREYLINFSVKASQLTVTGIIILVVVALLLMETIDSALNHIWHVRDKRKPVTRFFIYLAVLTIGPVLIGAGFYSTSYLLSLPVIDTVDASLRFKGRLLASLPFFTTSIAFILLYILVPACYVGRRNAIIGGVTAALMFEVAKYSFGIYVKAVPAYEMIYGALAVMPLFLVWIYLSWLIVLLGAQITYSLSVFRQEKQ